MLLNEVIRAVAAFGVWPALPLTGSWLLTLLWHKEHPSAPLGEMKVFSLHFTIGIMVWSMLLVVLAVTNHYEVAWVGTLGWIVTAYRIYSLRQKKPGPKSTTQRHWFFIFLLGLAAVAYLGFPTESIYVDRDPGVYTNHAIYMANHGRSDIFYPWPENLKYLFDSTWAGFPGFFGFYPKMKGQFPHGFPVWLSQAYATLGYHGLIRLNGVFALLAAALFYHLVCVILPTRYALAATVLFALNPAQIWLARITMAEIFGQLFIWSGLLLLTLAIKDQKKILARWAGLLLAFSALVRLDNFILLPLLMLTHLLHKTITSADEKATPCIWCALYETAFPVFALSYVYYQFINPWYYVAHYSIVQPAFVASIILLAILIFLPRSVLARIGEAMRLRLFVLSLGVAIFLLAVFGYWIRPGLEPFALLPNSTNRSYIELTFVNLAQYLSFPLAWMAIIGWILLAWEMLRKNADTHLIALWVIGGGSALIYLFNPYVTPDHFWAIRRFVPMVIPAFIAFAAYAAWGSLRALPKRYKSTGEALAFLGVIVFLVQANFYISGFTELKGTFNQIEALAKKLPQEEIILADGYSMWISPLYFAFNRNVVPLDMSKRAGFEVLREWVRLNKEKGKPVYILRGDRKMYQPVAAQEIDKIVLTHSFMEHTPFPLPKAIVNESIVVRIYQIAAQPSFITHSGASPAAAVHRPETP